MNETWQGIQPMGIGVPNRIQQILAQAATPDPAFNRFNQPGQAVESGVDARTCPKNLVRFIPICRRS